MYDTILYLHVRHWKCHCFHLCMKSYSDCFSDMDGKDKPVTWDCLMNTVISSTNFLIVNLPECSMEAANLPVCVVPNDVLN